MIAISNANQPSWKTVNVKSYIPESLKHLEELSRNLWWVWNEEAKELFSMLDSELYKAPCQPSGCLDRTAPFQCGET